MEWDTSVQFLKGVGPKRAASYKKLGISTIRDLLYHFPRDYIDLSNTVSVFEAPLNEAVAVKAVVVKKFPEQRIRKGMAVYKLVLSDGEAEFTVIFYNNPYVHKGMAEGEEYYLYGRFTGNLLRKEMNSPMVLPASADKLFRPVYPLTEGITGSVLQNNIKEALGGLSDGEDFLPAEIRHENKLCTLSFALKNIHFPENENALMLSRKRLSFDELFLLQLGMLRLKNNNRTLTGCKMKPQEVSPYIESLPFSPTGAQLRAIGEITADMQKETPMNRLLQGDVGSGKTAVAAAACYFAWKNGWQSALMAPTEILASQHFETLSEFLSPLGIPVCLLTGSLTAKQKKALKEKLAAGEFAVAVGTHALLQKSTEFSRLGLVITDEQHRFGVEQRALLSQKGDRPHKLVMSATPIPRTLGLIMYGDLDISVLDEMPKNRLPVETFALSGEGLRQRAYGFVKKELLKGRQAYLVCPAIEDDEAAELHAAVSYADNLKSGEFRDFSVGLLHGRLSPAEKEEIMLRFKNGGIQLLVATTVIEVGVDVPNATVMMIEDSDRFGLSQLHQLRGRVGRGSHQSYCILMTESKTPEAKERLKILSSLNDGFKIAEEDLRLRGCGDFFGDRQHGIPPLKIAELDTALTERARRAAVTLLESDSELKAYPKLKAHAGARLLSSENGLD